jgi:hypothetical protein
MNLSTSACRPPTRRHLNQRGRPVRRIDRPGLVALSLTLVGELSGEAFVQPQAQGVDIAGWLAGPAGLPSTCSGLR